MLKKLLAFIVSCAFMSPVISAPVQQEEYPVVILGGGIAALTSAVYLSRAGITPLVITGPIVGGAIAQSHSVQNWPGELEISGIELSERVKSQAEHNGAILLSDTVVDVDFSKRPFLITTKGPKEQLKTIKAQSCIIGLGATPRLLEVPGEKQYWAKGVYSCAVCDGGLYKNRTVAVVGGGDSALIEADYLSNLASRVYLIVRKDQFRTVEAQRMEEIVTRPNVEVLYETEVKEVKGDGKQVTHVVVKDRKKNYELAVDGVFLAIGSEPNTKLLRGQLQLDSKGLIVLKNHQEASVPGVFAMGDAADGEFNQAISAAGDAAKAALQAQKYLTQSRARTTLASRSPKVNAPQKAKTQTDVGQPPVVAIQTAQELQALLDTAKGGVILDFYGDFCGPCRMIAPQYEAWAKEFQGKITFAKVDVEKAPALCQAYQIRVVPTLVIMDKEGKVIRRSSGTTEIAEVEKLLDQARNQSVERVFVR